MYLKNPYSNSITKGIGRAMVEGGRQVCVMYVCNHFYQRHFYQRHFYQRNVIRADIQLPLLDIEEPEEFIKTGKLPPVQ